MQFADAVFLCCVSKHDQLIFIGRFSKVLMCPFPLAGMSIFGFYFVVCGCMSRLSNRLRLPGSSMIFIRIERLLAIGACPAAFYRMVPLFLLP